MMYSIITVCYNSEKTIGKCVESVTKLESDDYEYIIIDGESSDATLEILRSYINIFKDKKIRYKIYSEKDNGIYDAMNKGIQRASGDWVIFMNSDDEFSNKDVLNNISENIVGGKCDVIYGDVIVRNNDGLNYKKAGNLEELKCGYKMPFCHQSTFTKTEILKGYMFNTKYKIIGDIDLYLKLYKDKYVFKHVNFAVSIFSNEGISQTRRIDSIIEAKEMLRCHDELNLKRKVVLNVYLLWYSVKPLLPKKVLKCIERVRR